MEYTLLPPDHGTGSGLKTHKDQVLRVPLVQKALRLRLKVYGKDQRERGFSLAHPGLEQALQLLWDGPVEKLASCSSQCTARLWKR